MLKFFHVADIHLDSPLKNLEGRASAPVERLRLATREAVRNLVRLADAERPDVIVIAGDVFDGDWRDFQTGLFFVRQMLQLRELNIPVLAIRGNHDAESHMSRDLDWRGSVRFLASDRAESVTASDLGLDLPLIVHGQSFADRAVTANLAAAYPRAVPGVFNLGLLHTSLDGAEGHATYAPCSKDDLRRLGYDYWALGHIHKRAIHELDGPDGPKAIFPGNLQGRHVREDEPKGVFVIEWDGNRVTRCELKELDVARWHDVTVPLSAGDTSDDARTKARQAFQKLNRAAPKHLHAVRLRLTGATAANRDLRRHGERFRADLEIDAEQMGGDRLWLSDVRIATTEPNRAAAVDRGPVLETLRAVLGSLRADPAAMLRVVDR